MFGEIFGCSNGGAGRGSYCHLVCGGRAQVITCILSGSWGLLAHIEASEMLRNPEVKKAVWASLTPNLTIGSLPRHPLTAQCILGFWGHILGDTELDGCKIAFGLMIL